MLSNKNEYLEKLYNEWLNDEVLSQQFELARQKKKTSLTQTYSSELNAIFGKLKRRDDLTEEVIKRYVDSLKRALLLLPINGMSLIARKAKDLSWIFCDMEESNTGFHIMSTYHGLIILAKFEGIIEQCISGVVCKNDELFDEVTTPQGDRYIVHKIGRAALQERGPIECAYAYTKHTDGSLTYSIVSKESLDVARYRANSSFWISEPAAMSCKTAVRQESKNWGDNLEPNSLSSLSTLMNYEQSISDIEFSENKSTSEPISGNPSVSENTEVIERRSFTKYIAAAEA